MGETPGSERRLDQITTIGAAVSKRPGQAAGAPVAIAESDPIQTVGESALLLRDLPSPRNVPIAYPVADRDGADLDQDEDRSGIAAVPILARNAHASRQ
jgi:hypothetical protein